MVDLVFYNCPDCGCLFIGEYGVKPLCPGLECAGRRYEEIIKSVNEKKVSLESKQLQYYTERRVVYGCVIYSCSNCNVLFFRVNNDNLVCPICGYYCDS